MNEIYFKKDFLPFTLKMVSGGDSDQYSEILYDLKAYIKYDATLFYKYNLIEKSQENIENYNKIKEKIENVSKNENELQTLLKEIEEDESIRFKDKNGEYLIDKVFAIFMQFFSSKYHDFIDKFHFQIKTMYFFFYVKENDLLLDLYYIIHNNESIEDDFIIQLPRNILIKKLDKIENGLDEKSISQIYQDLEENHFKKIQDYSNLLYYYDMYINSTKEMQSIEDLENKSIEEFVEILEDYPIENTLDLINSILLLPFQNDDCYIYYPYELEDNWYESSNPLNML